MAKYAYVYLLMKGDAYLPGIATSIYSLIKTGTKHDIITMVTDDVSSHSIEILKKISIVKQVPYLKFETKRMANDKIQHMYQNWLNTSYTKWNMLMFDEYDKILFIDGDTLVVRNIDHLFEFETPSAPFNNPYIKPAGKMPNYLKGRKDHYGYLLEKEPITPNEINNILTNRSALLTANCVLLKPSKKDYEEYIDMLKRMEPFGFINCYSMSDETSIAYFYSMVKKVDWYNIHQRYNFINWKENYVIDNKPVILHYFSPDKPWDLKFDAWPDVITWYRYANLMVKDLKIKPEDCFLKKENLEGAIKAKDTFAEKYDIKL